MTHNAVPLIEDSDSERPTLIPPSRSPSRSVNTSDVDATWPDEAPRHSFIAERVPTDDSGLHRVTPPPEPAAPPVLVPPMDAYEDERALLVYIDMPGVTPEMLFIHLSNVALHVSGIVAPAAKGKTPLVPGRREIVIDVPRGLESDAVDASLRNGLLRIRIDKSGIATRHVEILHAER